MDWFDDLKKQATGKFGGLWDSAKEDASEYIGGFWEDKKEKPKTTQQVVAENKAALPKAAPVEAAGSGEIKNGKPFNWQAAGVVVGALGLLSRFL